MPSSEAHTMAVHRNLKTIEHLCGNCRLHGDWIATVTFYTAVHTVEGLFAIDNRCPKRHTNDHVTRNDVLKGSYRVSGQAANRFDNIWKHYRLLWQDSLIARYLEDGSVEGILAKYHNAETLVSKLVGHRLRQVVRSAQRLAKNDEFLSGVEDHIELICDSVRGHSDAEIE